MKRRAPLLSSLRGRILSIVVLGAILPLGLIGWWLSQSAATSGEQRLRAQLDSSLTATSAAMDARWVFHEADLQLLTNNDVARRMMEQPGQPLNSVDSAYLSSLESSLRPTLASVTYRDSTGRTRWRFGSASTGRGPGATLASTETFSEPSIIITRPLFSPSGVKIGDVSAALRLSSLLPIDSIPHVITGSALRMYDARSQQPLGSPEPTEVRRGERWISAQRKLAAVPVEVELSAPASAYLEPFERAARIGLVVLISVAGLAIALSAVLAARLTRSLEELVEGAEAVARGDIERTVRVSGGTTEVSQLAVSFNAMTSSLRTTIAKLSQRESLAAMGEFAASLSHEVRNALTAVRVDLQRAEEDEAGESEKSRELITRALRNTHRLDSIVSGALRVARSGHAPMEEVDLRSVVQTAIQLTQSAMSNETRTLIESDNEGPLLLKGDRVALEQLFVNVLVNAGQAMPAGGEIRVAFAATSVSVLVAINDSGRGICAEDLARLGEPFYSSRPGGVGLGVSIARRIAIAHGGDIAIESWSGRGTRVTVTLRRSSGIDERAERIEAL